MGDWIAVEDRLPENRVSVMIADIVGTVAMGMRAHERWFIYYPATGVDIAEYPVTHWQPLPPPPKL